MNVKTASTGSLTVLVAAALLSALMAVPGAADSIGTVYNMDRMLSEPHPLADQYGTRWQPPPASAPAYAPGATRAPAPMPTPSPFPATAPEPPPTTFAPPEPPPLGLTAPPLPPSQPAPQPQPVAKVTPVGSAPPPAMAPRLSIDAEGVDLKPDVKQKPEAAEPEKSAPQAMERKMEQPGPRPPLPPG